MYTEHPFAQYVRILGKGKNGSRPLTTEEAYESFRMILNEVEALALRPHPWEYALYYDI